MKVTLRLILSLVAVIAFVAFVFSLLQARQEEERLLIELEKRASFVTENIKITLQPILNKEVHVLNLQSIIDGFVKNEHLVGIDIQDVRENSIAVSTGLRVAFADYAKVMVQGIQEVERLGVEHGTYLESAQQRFYAYAVPLQITDKPVHVMTLIYDADYVRDRVVKLWLNSFWRAMIQALLISIVTLFIIYFNVMSPIQRTTEWIRRIRRGESVPPLKDKEQLLLGPLAVEITRMAKSLEKARFAAEEEARLRYAVESRWTSERLKEFVRLKLGDRPLFVVSNREPYMHMRNGKDIECIVPASGLITALEPILNACGGTWVAQGSGDADRETVDANDRIRVPPEEPKYTLRRVWIDKDLNEGFYSGFSNEGLWPLCHIAHTRPIFRAKDWADYKAVNQEFARAVAEELDGVENPYILIQDYHFALLPRMIKELRPDAKIAIFWHIPWPNPESFGICPWRKEVLQGMLGADILGFHTQFHCNNFIETVDRYLESRVDYEHFTINREGHTTLIKPFPISIKFDAKPADNVLNAQAKESLLKEHGLNAQFIGVGVDRLDYTKGLLERFRAVESLFELDPSYIGKFTFVEIGAPSRTMIPKYKQFIDEVVAEVERINNKYKTNNWQPIQLLMKHHSHQVITQFYQAADLCLVTSLHDGMNLVAKEYIAARHDDQGVLILSQFTGAARELQDALIVNPYDIGQTSKAIKSALEMPQDEQTKRMQQMRETVQSNNIYRWAGDLVGQMTQVRSDNEEVII